MKIVAHRGNSLHAPENSYCALISAYVGGADVLDFNLRLTKDDRLVISQDATTDRMTGESGKINELTLSQLKAFDWSETYEPPYSPGFKYYTDPKRKLAPVEFPTCLDGLPEDVEFTIGLKFDTLETTIRRATFLRKTADAIKLYRIVERTLVYSEDPENLKAIRVLVPGIRIATFDKMKSPDEQLALLELAQADGLVMCMEEVFQDGVLTDFGLKLSTFCQAKRLRVGALLYPSRSPSVFTASEYTALQEYSFVWAILTDSMLESQSFTRPTIPLVNEKFATEKIDREHWAFGYAKANQYPIVYQSDGVHIDIDPFTEPFPPPSTDPLEQRFRDIETKALFTAKDWPYYSGGGVGYVPGIRGDFSAEVDYMVENVGQATTLEMAIVNVDPGVHVGHRPSSFRDKDSFYDPHGAPPYVGVEHDEDDGYRINWNLGNEYDNNQYGKPVGDGKTPHGARLRLDRRGPYFAAYYRDAIDEFGRILNPRDWVCVGVVRNDSLNPVVFLRCVGKRWRQEKASDPTQFEPVISNKFTFKNLTISKILFPTL